MDPISLLLAGTALSGGIVSGVGSIISGNAANEGAQFKANAIEQGGLLSQRSAEYQAVQFDQQAGEARSLAQNEAFERRRAGRLAMSTLLARAAAGGGGATDQTVTHLGEDIAERSEYFALTEMFKGESKARGLEDQATATRFGGAAKRYGADLEAAGTRYAGNAAQTGSYFGAAGSILSGIGSAAKIATPGGGSPSTGYG